MEIGERGTEIMILLITFPDIPTLLVNRTHQDIPTTATLTATAITQSLVHLRLLYFTTSATATTRQPIKTTLSATVKQDIAILTAITITTTITLWKPLIIMDKG